MVRKMGTATRAKHTTTTTTVKHQGHCRSFALRASRLGGLLEPSRGPLGAILEASRAFLVLSWGPLGLLGRSWGLLGSLGSPPRAILEASWPILELSWDPLGCLEGPLGAIDQRKGECLMTVPPSVPQNEPPGALLGRSWALLGPSWVNLSPSWGPPACRHLKASRAHRKRKGEKATHTLICY